MWNNDNNHDEEGFKSLSLEPNDVDDDDSLSSGGEDPNTEQGFSHKPPSTKTSHSSWTVWIIIFVSGTVLGALLTPKNNNNSQFQEKLAFPETPTGQAITQHLFQHIVENPHDTLVTVSQRMQQDHIFLQYCHPILHRVAMHATHQLGWYTAVQSMLHNEATAYMRMCNAAYIHGVVEAYLRSDESENFMEAVKTMDEQFCQQLDNVGDGVWECRHGVGHGILLHARDKADMELLLYGLQQCVDPSLDTPAIVEGCQDGVWMDFFLNPRLQGSFYYDATSAAPSLQLCQEVGIQTQNCALYVSTEYLLHKPRHYTGAMEWCQAAVTAGMDSFLTDSCFVGTSSMAIMENLHDFPIVETTCMAAPHDHRVDCMNSAFLYYTVSADVEKIPREICRQLAQFEKLCDDFHKSDYFHKSNNGTSRLLMSMLLHH